MRVQLSFRHIVSEPTCDVTRLMDHHPLLQHQFPMTFFGRCSSSVRHKSITLVASIPTSKINPSPSGNLREGHEEEETIVLCLLHVVAI